MPRLKNIRHERFCLSLFDGNTQTQAAIQAGYKESRARKTASRLVTYGDISKRIDELKAMAESEAVMSVTERKIVLSEMGRVRLTDFVEVAESGVVNININQESAHNAGIQAITSRKVIKEDEDPTIITRIKLHDPVKAIAELNKMEGDYAPEKHAVLGEVNVRFIIGKGYALPDS